MTHFTPSSSHSITQNFLKLTVPSLFSLSLSHSYSCIESSLVELDIGEFEGPPKKKASIILRKESCGDAPYFFPSFLSNIPELIPETSLKIVKNASSAPAFEGESSSSSPSFLKRAIDSMPPMSKLSMNIGYAKHLATAGSIQGEKPYNPNNGQTVPDSGHYPSFNLLSKAQSFGHITASSVEGSGAGNPLGNQQGYYVGLREAQRQPACQVDYPMHSKQLTSMYACSKNSSSINDFKLLMVQTSPSYFSNGNDGSIWQPRLKSSASSSTCMSSSVSVNATQSNSYDEIDSFDYDDIPSFDEAMDMMAARIL